MSSEIPEKTRRISYQGKQFHVPERYKYIAADVSGRVYAYVDPPIWNPLRQEYNDDGAGTMKRIGDIVQAQFPVKKI